MMVAGAAATAAVTPAMGQLLGQQVFPTNSPWNQNISAAPVATNSAAVITSIGSSIRLHPDWGTDSPTNGTSPLYGIPYNVVHGNSVAKVSVIIDNYPGESDIVPMPIPANAVIEGDYQNGPNPNGAGYNTGQRGDSHLIVWDQDNNVDYELYGATRPSDPFLFDGVTPHADGKWHAAQETVWNFKTNEFRPLGYTSADAAGLPILAGLVRPEEGLPTNAGGLGSINHALRMTLASSIVSSQYIYPASHVVTRTGKVPFGARLRLMNTPTVNNLITNMGTQAQIIARAMQQYGLILADIGSSMFVTGSSASGNATNQIQLVWNMNDVLTLRQLTAANFELVDLTPLVSGLSASNGAAGSSLSITGKNFSGAAGHLSVFFGTNAASSVNVLSDSQISLNVPPGSGTAEVKVQSGAYNPDTYDSPGANVNEPIFGYGTSALTPADKFTYTSVVAVPTIQHVASVGGNFVLSGTNNTGPGGTYHVLTSTNLALPRASWPVVTNGSFDSKGNFSFTNAITPNNAERFYTLQVP
jgi:hypothetical protein